MHFSATRLSEPNAIPRHENAASGGARHETPELIDEAYQQLRRLARSYLQRGGPQTLQPTALVHEAYLRLARGDSSKWRDRGHFLATASLAMRQILVNSAKRRRASKRGGGAVGVELEDAVAHYEARGVDLVALDEALDRLAALSEVQCRVVELRFFGGLTNVEVADAMGIALRKVEREWRAARAWLRTQIEDDA